MHLISQPREQKGKKKKKKDWQLLQEFREGHLGKESGGGFSFHYRALG